MKPNISLDQLRGLNVSQDLLDDLLEDHEELVDTLLHPGLGLGAAAEAGSARKVLGVGITENEMDGRPTGEPAIRLLVDKLDDGGPAPPTHSRRGAPILVHEVGQVLPAAGYQDRYRPAPGGVSIGPCQCPNPGTLGCIVQSGAVKYLLGNNHALTYGGLLPLGTTISQPALMDAGVCPADVIATLSHIVPLVFGGVSLADAAIAAIANVGNVDPRIMRAGNVLEPMVAPVTLPIIGMAVQKSGRTTGWTRASRIEDIGVTLTVNYEQGPSTFNNAFSVKRASGYFAGAGDSGAVITTDPENQPVGLLVWTDAESRLTFANTMSDVLNALAVQTGAPVGVVY